MSNNEVTLGNLSYKQRREFIKKALNNISDAQFKKMVQKAALNIDA